MSGAAVGAFGANPAVFLTAVVTVREAITGVGAPRGLKLIVAVGAARRHGSGAVTAAGAARWQGVGAARRGTILAFPLHDGGTVWKRKFVKSCGTNKPAWTYMRTVLKC